MKRGLLIIMSGPSGVGKGTIREKLMEDKTLNLFYSVSMTTRNPRPGEQDGREYYFVSKEDFQKNIDNGNLLEWAEFVGNRYGTPKDKVEKMRDEGKNVLLEIDVKGTSQVLSKLDKNDVISIFIAPPSLEELENCKSHSIRHILDTIDCLVDGPFIQEERDITLPMRGSRN